MELLVASGCDLKNLYNPLNPPTDSLSVDGTTGCRRIMRIKWIFASASLAD
jgi:hypothetical protein